MRRIDTKIALDILKTVHKYEPLGLGYSELQRKTGALKKGKIYYYWIKTLRNCNLLTAAALLHLTKLSREEYEIGLLPSLIPDRYILVEKEEEEKERVVFKNSFAIGKEGEEERERLELATKKAACMLLLSVHGASGTLDLSPVTDRKAEPGI